MNATPRPAKPQIIRMYIASLAGGGSERVCVELCNGFVSRGVKVELLLVNAFGPYLDQLDQRVRLVDFKASRGLKALLPVSRLLRSAPRIPVLVFGFNLGFSILLARSMGWHHAPVIYREGSAPKCYLKQPKKFAYSWTIRQADKVIAQSTTAREELVGFGMRRESIQIIPNPQRRPGLPVGKHQRLPNAAPLVLAVGRLAPEKGFDRLIRGFQRLHAAIPGARLAILGEGLQRARLEQLTKELDLKECVSLPGFMTNIDSWYQRASLFVLSSHHEGQPNVLIEAILGECPVVCAAGQGGTVELMRDVGLADCIVADARFEQLFSEQARRVLDLDTTRWQSAREKLAALTDSETVVQQYLNVCEVAAGQPDPAGY